MVVQVSYPGVYVVEKPSGVHTIAGVSTSIAAFFGQALEGPVNKAVRLLSPLGFEKTFGKPHPDSELSTAVRMFFQNGGSDCYVVRLVKGGEKANVTLKNENEKDVLKFEAKEIGSWGNELRIEVDYKTSQPEETFNLRIYRMDNEGNIKTVEELFNCSPDIDSPKFVSKLVKQKSNLVNCETAVGATEEKPGFSLSRRPLDSGPAGNDQLAKIISSSQGTFRFKISVDGSPLYGVDLKDAFPEASPPVSDIDAFKKMIERINSALPSSLTNSVNIEFVNGPGTTKLLKFLSNTAEQKSIVIQQATSNDLTKALMLGTEQGGLERSSYAPLRPASNGVFFKIDSINLDSINQLAVKRQSAFNTVKLDGQDLGLEKRLVTVAPDSEWYKSKIAGVEGTDGIREKFGIIAKAINDANIAFTAYVAGSRLIVRKRSGPPDSVSVLTTSLDDIGSFFKANPRLYLLDAGRDGKPLDASAYLGNENDHTGLFALDLVDLFNIMIIPKDKNLSEDDYRSLWGPASAYCKDHRAFLIIDPPESWDSPMKVLDPDQGINSLRIGLNKDHAAVYFPNLVIRDDSVLKTVGPGGVIAGLYARTDSSGGGGVWTAPAGVSADIRGGISDLEISLTDAENGPLNKEGVNCLRKFPSGIVSWGARTIDGADDFGSEWKYVPIRRLALFLEESLYQRYEICSIHAKRRTSMGSIER